MIPNGIGQAGNAGEDASRCFETGRGIAARAETAEDYAAAHMWFNVATALGHPRGRVEREAMADELSPALIAGAQRKARQWLAARNRTAPAPAPCAATPPATKPRLAFIAGEAALAALAQPVPRMPMPRRAMPAMRHVQFA